jgi:hypothetical protein
LKSMMHLLMEIFSIFPAIRSFRKMERVTCTYYCIIISFWIKNQNKWCFRISRNSKSLVDFLQR